MIDLAALLRVAVAGVVTGEAVALIDGVLLCLRHIANAFAVARSADEIDSNRIINVAGWPSHLF